MRNLVLVIFLIIGFCHPAPATGTTVFSADENSFQFLVYQRTIDGDTIKVDVANLPEVFGKNLSVRLRGIDAPSLRGKCQQEKELAKKSKDFLHFLIKNERFTLQNIERGKYFRILADIRLSDGRNVSDIMLFNNHAVKYDGGTKTHNWCS